MRFALSMTGFACLVLSVFMVEARWGWPPRRPTLDPTVIFNSADTGDDNCLSVDELVVALKQARIQTLPLWVVTKIYAHYDDNNDDCLDLEEFKLLFTASQASKRRFTRGIFSFPFFRPKVPIVASDIFDKVDRLPGDNCLNRAELRLAIMMLGGGKLPLWVVDVLLAEYAADDTCLTVTEYATFVAAFRDLRRAEIFDNAGDSSCLSATEFQKAIQAALGRNLSLWNVNMILDLYDTNNTDCIDEAEFDAFMDVLEV